MVRELQHPGGRGPPPVSGLPRGSSENGFPWGQWAQYGLQGKAGGQALGRIY